MYFITTKRMLEVCFFAHPNIQYRTFLNKWKSNSNKASPQAADIYQSAARGIK